jgi:rfaE bifunctional protein nucleotidyltransferase chain/domain
VVPKLKTPVELATIRDAFASDGRRLVFTNGCFDILHVGHVRYLAAARALGDALVVAINGDDSVRGLKGPGRPVNRAADRAEIVASLACVDFVTVFESKRVTDLVRIVRPQIYAKGGDYSIETLDAEEVAALRAAGTEIRILPLVPDRSTTATLARIAGSSTAS